ncbi:MAG TPA: deoxyribose-phosphate aldolase, partial [Bacillota bacterium]|nr:deoxyribose-phosphate aldolase [Bacillota bacterium]
EAVWKGALEVDVVINLGALKAGDLNYVKQDIQAVVGAARDANPEAITKVIIETCILSDEEKVRACHLAEAAGARFVKTSTGFSSGGATVSDVALMKQTVSDNVYVKASGGIRDWSFARELLEAGADRLGASAGIQIIQGFLTEKNI